MPSAGIARMNTEFAAHDSNFPDFPEGPFVAGRLQSKPGVAFMCAIDTCGKVLAAHFPRTDISRDELPDRIYLV
jgi:hypothetical protein